MGKPIGTGAEAVVEKDGQFERLGGLVQAKSDERKRAPAEIGQNWQRFY